MQQQDDQPQKARQKDIQEVFVFSEFINTIRLIYSQSEFKLLKPMSELQPNSQLLKQITHIHFRQLAIQFFYLLYSSSHKRIVPVPQTNSRFICYSYDSSSVILCLTKFLTFQTSQIKDYQTSTPYFFYYKTFISAIHPYWKEAEKRAQQPVKLETMTADYFLKQLELLTAKNQFATQKEAFNAFQRCEMVVQTSVLLRIRNSALICVIRKCNQLMQLYKKHRIIQNQLSQEYNDRRRRKNNLEKILQTQRNIEKNVQEFFLSLKTNPRYFIVEDKKKREAGGINNKMVFGLKVFQLVDLRKTVNDTNSNQTKADREGQIDEDYYNLYEMQYCSAKNIIIVRMITDIVLDWATSDSILYKWNTLTFQTSNVGLQTVQRLNQQKKPQKLVVIRGTSYFNKKQPVLQKMLTLIDITMATYKSIQWQMKTQTFFAKNIAKIDESYQKINHYLRAIHKCCIKSYSAIMMDAQ